MSLVNVEGHEVSKKKKRKNRKALYMALGSCIVASILGMLIVINLYDDRTTFENRQSLLDDNIDINPVADAPGNNTTAAYHYWYAPENSFGIAETKTLNWSYWKPWLKNNFYWNLTASPNLVDWYDANELLTINLDWDKTNASAKVTIILNTTGAPTDLYYRFELGCNFSLKSYINKSENHEYILTLQANATEDYQIYFNFSDVLPLIQQGKITIKHGVKNVSGQEYIGFRAQTVNKIAPNKYFEIDPWFGFQGSGASTEMEPNEYFCTKGTPTTGGTVDNITAYLPSGWTSGEKIKGVLYDSSLNVVTNGVTDERENGGGGNQVFVFSAPKPSITADTLYYLGIFTDGTFLAQYSTDDESGGSGGYYREHDMTYPNPDSPMNGWDSSSTSFSFVMWASYTEGVANTAPTITGEIPANTSTSISLQPTCNVTVNDADADTMNVTFASNYSGSWVNYQTNSSVGNGSIEWNPSPAFNTELTKYWWKVYCNDSTDNVSEVYHFTTVSNRSWQALSSMLCNFSFADTQNRSYQSLPEMLCNFSFGDVDSRTWENLPKMLCNFSFADLDTRTNESLPGMLCNFSFGDSKNRSWQNLGTMLCNFSFADSQNRSWQPLPSMLANFSFADTDSRSWESTSEFLCNFSFADTSNRTHQSLPKFLCNFSFADIDSLNWQSLPEMLCNFSFADNDSAEWQDLPSMLANFSFADSPTGLYLYNEYPSNESTDITVNVTLHIDAINTHGGIFNLSWYWGNSSADTTTLIGSNLNITNGTHYQQFYNRERETNYYIRVNLTNSTDYYQIWYNFTTEGYDYIVVAKTNFEWLVFVGVIACFVAFFVFIIIKKKKPKEPIKPYNNLFLGRD